MSIFDKKINKIVIFSFFIKVAFVFFFHEKNLSDEWAILFQNFQSFKSYSYYIFDGEAVPSSYMPPLYFVFIYLNKILSFDKINFIYLIYFNQILISSLTVYLFYKLCENFLDEKFSLLGALIFSIFPLMIYSNGLISSSSLQLFFYLLFINSFIKLFSNEINKRNLFFLILISALTLLLRGEFLIIFLFSLIFLGFSNKKKIVTSLIILLLTIILVSPYLIRNYMNTDNFHLVNVTGYALWKGNNQLVKVEGFHNSLHPEKRETWPKIPEFNNLYKKLDTVEKDKKYEINRDKIFREEAVKNIVQDKQKYLALYLQKIFSYFFLDLKSSIENYYNIFHIVPVFVFAICSIPGAIISLKKIKNSKIFYLFLLTCFLTAFISIFFILPRYKISIISFQILFSLFFFKYLFEKKEKKIFTK